jgi:hypothetical protein
MNPVFRPQVSFKIMARAFRACDYANSVNTLLECLQGIGGLHFSRARQLNHLDLLRVLEFFNQLFGGRN